MPGDADRAGAGRSRRGAGGRERKGDALFPYLEDPRAVRRIPQQGIFDLCRSRTNQRLPGLVSTSSCTPSGHRPRRKWADRTAGKGQRDRRTDLVGDIRVEIARIVISGQFGLVWRGRLVQVCPIVSVWLDSLDIAKRKEQEQGGRGGKGDLLSQSIPLNHSWRLIISAPSSPNPPLLLVTDPVVRADDPEADEPSRSSGSQRSETRRSVHSGERRGAGGNLRVVFQFRLGFVSAALTHVDYMARWGKMVHFLPGDMSLAVHSSAHYQTGAQSH